MIAPYIIFIKDKVTAEFYYRKDVTEVIRTPNGYRITFNNSKSYNYGEDRVKLYPYLFTQTDVLIYESGTRNSEYTIVDNYGEYLILRNQQECSFPIKNDSNVEICGINRNLNRFETILSYFKEIITLPNQLSFAIPEDRNLDNDISHKGAKILLKALDNIETMDSRNVFSKYINGVNPPIPLSSKPLIFPFGCNESQKLAVETALGNSISIIEGPPGTGKTQTILNIVANLVAQNKTIGIVSNNNSAVFNIYEKLNKHGYNMLVAPLGRKENKLKFFEQRQNYIVPEEMALSQEMTTELRDELIQLDGILTQCFHDRNELAKLKTQLTDIETEYKHIQTEQPLSNTNKLVFDKKFRRAWTHQRVLDFKNLLSGISTKRLSLGNILQLIFQYGLLKYSVVNSHNQELHTYINHKFYDLYIDKIKDDITNIENRLLDINETSTLERFTDISKQLFHGSLYLKYSEIGTSKYTASDYLARFDNFIKHHPVILSSTLSLHNSVPSNFLFDYLIIDEASQVDIIKSAVCFSCSRNAIIVGDSMQLTHIVSDKDKEASKQLEKIYSIPPAYNYIEYNILNSLKRLYNTNITSVLLKEHYRCHPTIIGFCNKKYYNNNLVIMTNASNHPFRIIETNIGGSADRYNQRQIDETVLYINENYADDTKIGVIAPYRNHANMLQRILPQHVEADTIHKYQGREMDTIIFNTVCNQINEFIDNPNLINVAVSRAINEFIIVKPTSMELPHGTNIGDLVRYICYTTSPHETIVKGNVSSVFDLLYKEYNKICTTFIDSNREINGSVAEVIIYKLLTEEILQPNTPFSTIDIVREYKLRDLVKNYSSFSDDEIAYIKHNARLDFLLYSKIDKAPILAIEVDGVSYHNNILQQQRDAKKDRILDVLNIPILRLSTNGFDERNQIIHHLTTAMSMPTSVNKAMHAEC
ncbi:MAG: AAA domain-containing protein [Marinifilaceae bacterium]